MKKSLLLLIVTILFSSCSIYEEIYFNEDMSVKYEMKFDASELLGMVSASSLSSSSFPTDSVLSFADIIAEHKDSLQTLSAEEQLILEDFKSVTLKIKSDTIDKTFFITLLGDFKDSEALNRALKVISEQKGKGSDVKTGRKVVDQFDNTSKYFWDGRNMKREIQPKTSVGSEASKDQNMMDMLSTGKMIVKYHFPKRVTKVNNPDALFSQDGKTIVIEYSTKDFMNSAKKINIEIETE